MENKTNLQIMENKTNATDGDIFETEGWTPTSIVLGSVMMLSTFPGLITNSILSYSMISTGLLSESSPVIYRLVFNLMLTDTFQLMLTAFYLAPSSILQSFLIPPWAIRIPSIIFLGSWYELWFMLDIIAMHRCFSMWNMKSCLSLFNHKNVNIIIAISWMCTVPMLFCTQYYFPCCRFTLFYKVYSYAYLDPGFNYSDAVIELPGLIVTSLLIVFCYILVIFKVRQHRRTVQISDARDNERKAQEIRLTIQFVMISSVFMISWIFFYTFPLTVPAGMILPYAMLTVIGVMNFTVNGFLYLRYNEKIKESVAIACGNRLFASKQKRKTKNESMISQRTKTTNITPASKTVSTRM